MVNQVEHSSPHVAVIAPLHRTWGNRVARECLSLTGAGYRVTALVKTKQREVRDEVLFIPSPPSRSRISRFAKIPVVFIRALQLKADIYHLHNPDMIPVALLLKALGKKVIYDTHEDFAKRLLLRPWIPRLLRSPLCRVISKAECVMSRYIDATLVTQDHQLEKFSSKTHLIKNAPLITQKAIEAINLFEDRIETQGHDFRLIYVGQVTRARGLFVMLDALLLLKQKGLNTRLWLLGACKTQVKQEAEKHPAWELVDFLGVQRQEKVFAYMKKAKLGLAILCDQADHKSAYPNKILEYSYWKLPFIASNFSLWRAMFDKPVGIWIEPDNPALLAEEIDKLVTDPEYYHSLKEAVSDAQATICWHEESQKLIGIYQKLLAKSS